MTFYDGERWWKQTLCLHQKLKASNGGDRRSATYEAFFCEAPDAPASEVAHGFWISVSVDPPPALIHTDGFPKVTLHGLVISMPLSLGGSHLWAYDFSVLRILNPFPAMKHLAMQDEVKPIRPKAIAQS